MKRLLTSLFGILLYGVLTSFISPVTMSKGSKNLSCWNAALCKKKHLYVILYFGKENLYEADMPLLISISFPTAVCMWADLFELICYSYFLMCSLGWNIHLCHIEFSFLMWSCNSRSGTLLLASRKRNNSYKRKLISLHHQYCNKG